MMRLGSLLVKEFIQFFRDRVILVLILWLYTVEVVICTYALGLDVEHLPLAVLDRDDTSLSRQLVSAVAAGDAFDLTGRPGGMATAEEWLRAGRARAVALAG